MPNGTKCWINNGTLADGTRRRGTGLLQAIADDLWLVDGPVVSFYGFAYSTRCAIARLEGGALWIWSPVELTPELEAAVRRCGEVRWLVSPNKLHHLFLPAWLRALEGARAYAPPGLVVAFLGLGRGSRGAMPGDPVSDCLARDAQGRSTWPAWRNQSSKRGGAERPRACWTART